jgi:hypothetical protein
MESLQDWPMGQLSFYRCHELCASRPQDDKESDQTFDSTSGFHDRHPYRIADIDNAARTLFDMKVAVTH